MESTAPDARPNGGVSRRTLVKGAAWAVPVIAVASAAPAFAASLGGLSLTGTGWGTILRCDVISGTTFCATQRGNPAPAGLDILVELPDGLEFVGGGTTRTLPTDAGGCVTVPDFRVTGAAGNYGNTIKGTIVGTSPQVSAFIGGLVTVNPGTIVQLRADFAHGEGASAATAVRSTGQTAVHGGISGNLQSNSTAAAVLQDGTVRFWYGDNSWPNGTAPTLHTLPTVTGATMVETFTTNGTNGVTGGVATDGTNVWQWYASYNSSSATVRPVSTGSGGSNQIGGTVLEIATFPTQSYVRTTTGIWRWDTRTSGAGQFNPTRVYNGATNGWSPYYDHRNTDTNNDDYTGVAYIKTSGNVDVTVVAGGTSRTNIAASGTPITQVSAASTGLLAVSANGNLYSYANHSTNNGNGIPRSWTQRDSNVTNIATWGISGYFGGTYIKNGVVHEIGGVNASWVEKNVTGLEGKTITQIFASDGLYLALTANGELYYWAGNFDHSGTLVAKPFPATHGAVVVDLGVWATHPGHYYSGAYAILASDCP